MKILDCYNAISFYNANHGKSYLEDWRKVGRYLEEEYQSPSTKKQYVFWQIWHMMKDEKGHGLRVISGNTFNFSAAYFSEDDSEIVLFYPTRWGVRVNVDAAASYIEKYEERRERKAAENFIIIQEALQDYLDGLEEEALDCFYPEIERAKNYIDRCGAYTHSKQGREDVSNYAIHIIEQARSKYDEEQARAKRQEELERDSFFW